MRRGMVVVALVFAFTPGTVAAQPAPPLPWEPEPPTPLYVGRLELDYGFLSPRGDKLVDKVADTNALLKSTALVAYPRREVAASSGPEWLAFLNSSLGQEDQFPEGFVSGAYHKHCPDIDTDQVLRAASSWIRRHEAAR